MPKLIKKKKKKKKKKKSKKQNLKYVCLVFTHSNVYYLNRFGLLHDLPSVFYTLKLNIIKTKPETCLPGVQALKHLSSKYSFI